MDEKKTPPPGGPDPKLPPKFRPLVTVQEGSQTDARLEILSMGQWYRSLGVDLRRKREEALAEWDARIDMADEQAALWEKASEAVGLPQDPIEELRSDRSEE